MRNRTHRTMRGERRARESRCQDRIAAVGEIDAIKETGEAAMMVTRIEGTREGDTKTRPSEEATRAGDDSAICWNKQSIGASSPGQGGQ